MIKYSLKKEIWDMLVEENKDKYSWNRIFRYELFSEKTIDDKTVEISPNIKEFYKANITSFEEINEVITKFTIKLFENKIITNLVLNVDDIKEFETQIQQIDTDYRIVHIDSNLNISCKHEIFKKICESNKNGLLCWDNLGVLVNPSYWESDYKKLNDAGLNFVLDNETINKLNGLKINELNKNLKAYFFKSKTGYRVLIYKLHKELIELLAERCKAVFNKGGKNNETIELVFIYEEMLEEIKNENSPDYKEIEKLIMEGYISFNCYMFTFPSVKLMFKKRNIEFNTDNISKKEYLDFDFEMKDIELWDIQQEAVDAWVANEMFGTIALPTGSGKTIIALKALRLNQKKTLIVVPTIELVFQWKKQIIKFLNIPEEKIGVWYSNEKKAGDITIITFQSGHKRIGEELSEFSNKEYKLDKDEEKLISEIVNLSGDSDLLILDEGHHAPAPVFQKIMLGIKSPKRLSLTATPYREDGNETLAFLATGEVVYKKDYATLAEKKYVSPIDYHIIEVPLSPTEELLIKNYYRYKINKQQFGRSWVFSEGAKDLLDEIYRLYDTTRFANKIETSLSDDIINDSEIKRILSKANNRKIKVNGVISFAESKFNKIVELCHERRNNKIIIFNQRVKGATEIYKTIKNSGIKNIAVITGSTPIKVRKEILNLFSTSKSGVIVTTTILDEGIDVPDADTIIIFNGHGGKRTMIQRVGRGCRYIKNKIERVYEIIAVPDYNNDKEEDYINAENINIDNAIIKYVKQCFDEKISPNYNSISYENDSFLYSTIKIRRGLLNEKITSLKRDISDLLEPERQKDLIRNIEEGLLDDINYNKENVEIYNDNWDEKIKLLADLENIKDEGNFVRFRNIDIVQAKEILIAQSKNNNESKTFRLTKNKNGKIKLWF